MDSPLSDAALRVKNQLDALLRLQVLDHQILEHREQVRQRQEAIARVEESKAGHRRVLDQKKQEQDQLLKDRRESERAVKERQEQIQKLGGQLYDVKTNDAYSALQNEIKLKKNELAALEERVLEMMLAEDETKIALRQAEDALRGDEQKLAVEQEREQQEIGKISAEIAALQQQWDAAAGAVDKEYLERYRKLRDAKAGMAMAKIENGICSGCRLTIRPQAAIELKKYRALLFCDNCARILYVD